MLDMLKRLLAERARVLGDTRKIYERCEAEERIPTAEEHQELDRRNADLDELDERIDQLNKRIQREASADEAREAAEALVRPREERTAPAEKTGDQITDEWFRSAEKGQAIEIPLSGLQVEKRGAGSYEVRDLTSQTAASGGATVPTTFRRQLMEHLIENSAIRQTRATILTTSSGEPLILPKTLTHTSAGTILAENTTFQEVDPTFGQGTLNAYKYPRLVQLPYELVQDTAVDILGYLARSFGQAMANGAGADFITGNGSSKPNGVIAAAGTTVQVTGGTYSSANGPTADQLIDLFYSVTEPYAKNGEWLARRATVGKIRKLKDSNGQYLWQPSLQVGQPETILGHPVFMDPNVPAAGTSATSVAFGDFSHYYIRDVGAIRFERSDDFAFGSDQVTFRVALRTDGDLMDLTGAIGTFVHGTVA